MENIKKSKSGGMPSNLVIEESLVFSQDISFFREEINIDWPERPGEHYRLLTYLTNKLNGIRIIDAGTYRGLSCLAFSQNPNNKVYTYDIEPRDISFLSKKDNVVVKNLDINAEDDASIMCCPLILLDIDPHNAIQERAFTDRLLKIGYTGFLICDDINLTPQMRGWWDSIPVPKYEVTNIGHMSGTGIVCYNSTLTII